MSNPRWTPPTASIIIHAMEQISLADSFPPVTEADWLALVGKALGGASFDALRTRLHGGLQTEPLYTAPRHDAPLPVTRGWHAVQPLTGDVEQFNEDLANGAEAFALGLDALSAEALGNLKYFLASDIDYYLAPGSSLADAAFMIAAGKSGTIRGSAGFDPLAAAARLGELPAEKTAFWADFADAAFYIREKRPGLVPFT